MTYSLNEYFRLDAEGQAAVQRWVVDHFGDYRLVEEMGVDGDEAWVRRLLENAKGQRYAVDGKLARETVRAPLKRPFPIQVSV